MTLVDRSSGYRPRAGIPPAPSAPVSAAVVRVLLRRLVRDLPVRVRMPDGRVLGAGAGDAATMVVTDPRLFSRIGRDHKIGFGEGYLAGEWHPDVGTDLADLLTPFAERLTDIVPASLRRLRRLVEARHPVGEANDPVGARANIARHYDLSNEVFALFLDDTMTYSSAWFADDPDQTFGALARAQRRKVDGILDIATVDEGTRLLEIGSGWGHLAIQAGQRGAHVDTITLSAEQYALARERIADAGLQERVAVRLQDYREASGSYDAVVSVEMIEAVGEAYWPAYFGAVADRLRPGGRFGLQAITMPHGRMLESRHAYGWVHKYVFPGGLIPSVEAIVAEASRAGLRLEGSRAFGRDYARTLRLWRERFTARTDDVLSLGFDERFLRVWEFYLAYSEAGFRSGHLDVHQFAFVNERH